MQVKRAHYARLGRRSSVLNHKIMEHMHTVSCQISTRLRLASLLFALFFSSPVWSVESRVNEPIRPLHPVEGLDPAKVALGDRLFHDPRLSGDGSVSCASCHILAINGSDSRASSVGVGGAIGPIKAPTVWNSGFNLVQFWDGRAATLEEQAAGPIASPSEMGSSMEQAVATLQQIPEMVTAFAMTYGEITPENIQDAIATFERSLVTLNSPFDRWLQGDDSALSKGALKGYHLFKSYGCISCHQGKNVGGNMFATLGIVKRRYFLERGGEITDVDLGRYNVTGEAVDRYMFKVPSLRLAARQSRFFHDGSITTLSKAIEAMADYQLGRSISPDDTSSIILFLGSLVGEHPRLTP